MTRAKSSLTLLAPLRYHVTRQARDGDRHVYGARSRFVTEKLLACMSRRWFGREDGGDTSLRSRTGKRIDVQSRALDMW